MRIEQGDSGYSNLTTLYNQGLELVYANRLWLRITDTNPVFIAVRIVDYSSELGIDPSGDYDSVEDRFDNLTSDDLTYGLVGDGVADNTTMLSDAFNSPRDVHLPAGTYLVTGLIDVVAGTPKRVIGDDKVVIKVSLPANTDLIHTAKALSFENITFEFNNGYVKNGILYSVDCGAFHLENITFQNIKDTNSTYSSILVYINPQGNTFDLRNITFNNALKKGNGTVGDVGGNITGIYVGGTGNYAIGSIDKVSITEMHNIDNSDAIIYEDVSGIYVITPLSDTQNKVDISNIYGYNFGKRLLKIQASNVTVKNVTGYSPEGDSLGVIGFLGGDVLGEKRGCSGSHIRAYGKMEFALSASAIGVKWHDVITDTTPGTKSGMSTASFGLLINGNYTEVDGCRSHSTYALGIGSTGQIIIGTKLKNIILDLDSTILYGLTDTNGNLGFDGLDVTGLTINVDSTFNAIPFLFNYLTNSNKGKNLRVRDLTIISNGVVNSYGLQIKYVDNVSLFRYRYRNTSVNKHFRLAIIDTCSNVSVDDVVVDGSAAIGVQLLNCTGIGYVNNVIAPNCDFAAYNNNSGYAMISNTDPAKVSGTATPIVNQRYSSGATAARPASNLLAGQQHYDTTLGKPIWWNGSVWKDAAGTTV